MRYIAGADGIFRVVNLANLKEQAFEIGPLRPPSESGRSSLLLRVTKNCQWNRCTFCYGRFYNRQPFEVRSVPDLMDEIDSVAAIRDEMSKLSQKLGYPGNIGPVAPILDSRALYGKETKNLDDSEFKNLYCLITVFNWLVSGAESVFLQDADALCMDTDQLIEVLSHLNAAFPTIKKITSFTRSKTLVSKGKEELSRLRQSGIVRLYVGLETGDEELLEHVDKGVTAEEHILAGKKALAAGFELSECIMPGLGGRSMWVRHAKNTARVLNEINPQYIGLSPFVPVDGTPLLEAYRKGEFQLTSPHERLREIKLMVENLHVNSRVCFTHPFNASYRSGNSLVPLMRQDYGGYKFPEEKETVLKLIEKGLHVDEKAFLDVSQLAGIDHL